MQKLLLGKPLLKARQIAKHQSTGPGKQNQPLSRHIDVNNAALQNAFAMCGDITFREFKLNLIPPVRALIVFADTVCSLNMIDETILGPLMQATSVPDIEDLTASLPQFVMDRLLSNHKTEPVADLFQLVNLILDGYPVLIIDGCCMAVAIAAQGYEQRTVDEPTNEPSIRGPKDGFVENLATNISLLRRRIRSSRLKVQFITVGTVSRTRIAVCYIEGIANNQTVEEVVNRVARVNTDSILDSGYIEEFIADEKYSLFPLVQNTERPDRAAAGLFEGKIAVIADNSPSVLIVPCTVVSLLQASEDYYNNALFASFIRIGRFIAINIALLAPAITVAAFSFHQELIPFALLNTVAGARENLPFPIFVEITFMELTFELLREAGIRLPRTVGQAVSTVGGLVIGQAAVTAGIVSPISVIIVGITAVASFTFPDYAFGTSIRILRFVLLLSASVLGTTGIVLGLMVTLAHLCSLRSFGVAYLSPLAPLTWPDLKDTFIRAPWWQMVSRPRLPGSHKSLRQRPNQGPEKPDEE